MKYASAPNNFQMKRKNFNNNETHIDDVEEIQQRNHRQQQQQNIQRL